RACDLELLNNINIEELDQESAATHATLLLLIFELRNDTSTEIAKQASMERRLILMDNGANEIKDATIGGAAHAAGEVILHLLLLIINGNMIGIYGLLYLKH
ncbi:34648_t:CDS:2, partial [Racocetra persica]